MKVCLLYFSPTRTTKTITAAIARGMNPTEACAVDITAPQKRQSPDDADAAISSSDFVIVGTPVYEDRIPTPVASFLQGIQGQEKRCAVVAVYGSVGPGIVRSSMADLLADRGFSVVATAEFIGQHSFSHKGFEIAAGRPDKSDLQVATAFGGQLAQAALRCKAITPYEEKLPLMARLLPTGSAQRFTQAPNANLALCSQCGACSLRCPMGAIDTETLSINARECIRCFACVRCCPTKARAIVLRKAALVRFVLGRKTAARKEPKWRIG